MYNFVSICCGVEARKDTLRAKTTVEVAGDCNVVSFSSLKAAGTVLFLSR